MLLHLGSVSIGEDHILENHHMESSLEEACILCFFCVCIAWNFFQNNSEGQHKPIWWITARVCDLKRPGWLKWLNLPEIKLCPDRSPAARASPCHWNAIFSSKRGCVKSFEKSPGQTWYSFCLRKQNIDKYFFCCSTDILYWEKRCFSYNKLHFYPFCFYHFTVCRIRLLQNRQ